jgi:murein peptide amidase A
VGVLVARAGLFVVLLAAVQPAAARAPAPIRTPDRPTTTAQPRTIVAGRSVDGRRIVALRDGSGPANVLVVGVIHGNETGGLAVVRALRELRPPGKLSIWTVRAANPDGMNAGTRQNAHGVDLNRNFPYRWTAAGRPWDTYYPGPSPASEPETKAMMALIRRLHPVLTVWFHQHMRLVVLERGGDNSLTRDYGRRVGLPARWLPYYPGTVTSWENHVGTKTAFVVELPAGALTAAAARRYARAAVAVGLRAA